MLGEGQEDIGEHAGDVWQAEAVMCPPVDFAVELRVDSAGKLKVGEVVNGLYCCCSCCCFLRGQRFLRIEESVTCRKQCRDSL